MKISRHIHYIQNPVSCIRYELTFDPPIDVESTLGKIDPFYSDVVFSAKGNSNRMERKGPLTWLIATDCFIFVR